MSAPRKFIRGAIRKPGALTASIKRMFGKRGFTKRGTIRVSVLRDLARNARLRLTRQRARFALTLRKLGRMKEMRRM